MNSKLLSQRGVLAVSVNFGLHTHKLRINFGISIILEWTILSNTGDCIFVDSGSQL